MKPTTFLRSFGLLLGIYAAIFGLTGGTYDPWLLAAGVVVVALLALMRVWLHAGPTTTSDRDITGRTK